MLAQNLIDVLKSACEDEKTGITHINGDDNEKFVSYRELFDKALKVLGVFQEKGMQKGDELVLQIEDNETFLYVFWACIMGGIIPVPVTIGNNDEHRMKLFRIWKILKKPYLVIDEKFFAVIEKFAGENGLDKDMEKIKNAAVFTHEVKMSDKQGVINEGGLQDIAFIQFSSGSTGDPKGIVLTHENLLTNLYAIIYNAKMGKYDKFLSWMPLTHDMGLIGYHLVPVTCGIDQAIIPTNLFIRRPTLWLKKASEHKSTILSSPNFGYKYFLNYFKPEIASDWDLSSIRLIYNGAEPIVVELCDEFLDCLKPFGLKRSSMYTVYGLAEASLAVSFPPPGEEFKRAYLDRDFIGEGQVVRIVEEGSKNAVCFADEGYPIKDCFIRICDQNGNDTGKMVVGYVRISGKNVTHGYYNNPEATNEIITDDGWLSTGDLGFIRDGRLIVTGRAKDVIFIDGQNYYPQDIERITESLDGVELGKVAVCSVSNLDTHREEILVFVHFKKKPIDFIPLVLNIKRKVSTEIGLAIRDVIPIRDIPKTTSGKIQRFKLKQNYLDGLYDEVLKNIHNLIEEELEKRSIEKPVTATQKILFEVCREVMGRPDIGINDNFIEFGGNSILMTRICAKLEEVLPEKVTIPNMFAYPTISKLADFIDNGGSISLEHVTLPTEYFNCTDNPKSRTLIEFTIQNGVLERLKNIASVENVNLFDIYTSVFAYLFKEISGEQSCTIQAMNNISNSIFSLKIDFKSMSDFGELFDKVNRIYGCKRDIFVYSIQDIGRIRLLRDSNAVIPLIYDKKALTVNARLSDVYDIILEIEESSEKTEFSFEFNMKRLDAKSLRNFIQNYRDILETIAKNRI